MSPTETPSAAVVGGGPAGLAAALALAETGIAVALAAPRLDPEQAGKERRTAALFGGSIELLRNLGAWPVLAPACEPVVAIRLIDDRDAWLKAPEVTFTAKEIGLEALGYNIPNAALVAALHDRVLARAGNIEIIETAGITAVEPGAGSIRLTTREGKSVSVALAAGADGRNSICRQSAGIETKSWTYPQSAVVCSFTHSRSHHGVSTEFHRANGPFTVVPLPGSASSLVWVEAPAEAARLARLDDQAMRATLERRLMGLLGTVQEIGPRSVFPLSGLSAATAAQNRVALIGEAGHVIPPIGAQGLNLGLRDAAALADCVAASLESGRDIGGPETMAAFAAARAADVTSRIWTVDILNRSLLSGLLPVHLARGAGLHALAAIGPFRRLVMREGVAPSNATPALMQPDGGQRFKERAERPAAARLSGP